MGICNKLPFHFFNVALHETAGLLIFEFQAPYDIKLSWIFWNIIFRKYQKMKKGAT
jgi:hypothetical protein